MGFALGPVARAAGYGLHAPEVTGSTNADGVAFARAGQSGPLWIVAERQTAGRGRRGRPWDAPAGNLAASLLLTTSAPRQVAASLGFVAGLALNAAVAEVATEISVRVGLDGVDEPGQGRLALKWPNDVVADGAKLAGILLEVEPVGGGLAVVIGIGVNVAAVPEHVPYAATSLRALGAAADAPALFSALSDAWVRFHMMWNEGRGLAEIRQLWLRQAAGLGAPVAVRLGDETIRGTFETLDEEGRLVVLTEAGARRIVAAGEVHFGAAATVR